MRKGKASKFLIYFQSYTFTFSRVARLQKYFEECSAMEDVVGFVVGTRPDCLSDSVIDLWNAYSKKLPIFVELGVQSFNDAQLSWMKRGHDARKSIWALQRLEKKCPDVNVGIHLMFGLPGESDRQIIETAELINLLPIQNVKLHNLHVLKNTPLEKEFFAKKFTPIDLDEYCHRVGQFLIHLNPNIPVHRLAANSARREELIAPDWTGDKMRTYQYMLDYLKNRDLYQGQKFVADLGTQGFFPQEFDSTLSVTVENLV
ncbi:MAG: TIGR01212 family radical SAM protein [Bdellovibrionales bacterium]